MPNISISGLAGTAHPCHTIRMYDATCTCGWRGTYSNNYRAAMASAAHGVKHKLAINRNELVNETITIRTDTKTIRRMIYSLQAKTAMEACYGEHYRRLHRKLFKQMTETGII